MRWTLPNILTILRLLAAPGVAVMFLYFNRPGADWFALILFGSAAATDWIDGRLARAWGLETRFGAAMDPIADKAMVLIALAVILGYSNMSPWIVLPATLIIFREVFVSGLREFIGPGKATLKVTSLAKWKTTVQMVAIAVLFSQGIFLHHLIDRTVGMSDELVIGVLSGTVPDEVGLRGLEAAHLWSGRVGVGLLWIAAVLTLVTGWDYLRKALPYLKEPK
ncbi:CDP-diacylglycerol--glycerol-3-phosphate 3-phosphatidyltransferase [Roseisalinus antarcticus]|uniref:CDP-diacylglycerol--glycerol-3-phosphate 3-phosphatidyltransferase n=1 Tax=Roseisalinus antarcticus TaxID=254357 RepID=A0A1Y5RPJ3_9RHOB|nr:CDP-diacylglycerol--glycerol-3-phosphate 3-phosphatidyltransferase [Roseisalinus antarcticus]SLN21193.1 CDP-diacylglycerol--glycerol-3-phosphate 3-phosphatidyltransferase [Roseisalinus antarcticus]